MRELTLNEIEVISGAGGASGSWSVPLGISALDLINTGNNIMVLGGSLAAAGVLTPGVPDLEPLGAGIFLTGAVVYGIGSVAASSVNVSTTSIY